MKKIIWIDTETTGLDPQRHGLIQLGMVMDIDGKIEGEIDLKIQPFPTDTLEISWKDIWLARDDQFIIPYNELPVYDVSQYQTPFEQMKKITTFLDKHISKFDKNDKAWVGGYNVGFDIDTLSAFCKKAEFAFLGSYINWYRIDVLNMLFLESYHSGLVIENYKLETVCKHFGIEIQAHDAMSDIKATRELYYLLGDK